jgi:hypothetical protein
VFDWGPLDFCHEFFVLKIRHLSLFCLHRFKVIEQDFIIQFSWGFDL